MVHLPMHCTHACSTHIHYCSHSRTVTHVRKSGISLSGVSLQVADEAAGGMLEVMQAFCDHWDSNTWQVAFTGPLSYLFDLPKTQLPADEDVTAVVSNKFCSSCSKSLSCC